MYTEFSYMTAEITGGFHSHLGPTGSFLFSQDFSNEIQDREGRAEWHYR